jgi:hypothetical protein
MTTPIKIGTIKIKTVSLLFVLNLAFVCTYATTPSNAATTQPVAVPTKKSAESITITGIVTVIYSGKHGYSVDVQTDKDGIYVASVTMPNLGGADKYQTCKIGDKVTFKGRTSSKDGIKEMTVEQIISISSTQTQLLIGSTGFRGIEVGDAIEKHGAYTHKTTLKMDGGRFDTYQIVDFDNNPAGYFQVDPQNKLLVGDIIVETPKAKTEKGIKIGDTYGDLLKVYPNIEVHGSETDGRTYATANNISYRLNVPNSTYNVDKATISMDGKITEIVINRFARQASVLAAEYAEMKASDPYTCWQASGVLNLHSMPSSDSKVEGKHFAGQTLNILETKLINDQLWVKVTYNSMIKMGYEDRFAEGWFAKSGAPTGWIGGAEIPLIRCK